MQNTIVKGLGKCPKLPWMIEFHSTADGKLFNNQLTAAFAENYLDHLSALNDLSKPRRKRLTQFVVIIPPKVNVEAIESFLKAGMTVAMIRFDYFTVEEILQTVELINVVNEDFGKKIGRIYPLAIALDVTESAILTGTVEKPKTEIEFQKGDHTKVLSDPKFKNRVSKDFIYVDYPPIAQVVKKGDSLIMGDSVEMTAFQIAREIVECIVERAGLIGDNECVKLTNTPIVLPPSESQKKLVEINQKFKPDMIFVGPSDIEMARRVSESCVLIFAKLEHISAVRNSDILSKVDGILIDGDKLLTTAKENLFLVQKSVVANCNKLGKPVVSSINCNVINKSQVNDIANTVVDGVDALLLPPDSNLLESICLICKAAESAIYHKQLFENLCAVIPPPIEPIIATSIAAVQASLYSNAAAIILLTTSGRSAALVAKYRPRCPIIALTRFGRIAKQLMIHRGVIPIFYVQDSDDTFGQNAEKRMQLGMTFGKLQGYIKTGDAVVIVSGIKNRVGFRNCVEVVCASSYDTIPDTPEAV